MSDEEIYILRYWREPKGSKTTKLTYEECLNMNQKLKSMGFKTEIIKEGEE